MPPSTTIPTAPATSTAADLARALNLPEPIARLLIARGYTDLASATHFLSPSIDHLHEPAAMLGMQTAVSRIRAALLAHEPILIYGDYDVDGTVATVLLKTACERTAAALGVTPDIRFHIPHRLREGYGMRETRIADAATEGVRLVVSVDTGIRAHAAAEEAARLGLDLIVTDHHLPDDARGAPPALAVLNPNQHGCTYPCKDLCGAAVAFKLAQALLESAARDDAQPEAQLDRLRTKTLPSFLKLLAVATIADSVALTDENRTVASIGLRELRSPAQFGLRALMELAGIDTTRPISATDVGFRLAPRLNAAGRMEVASDVVELFLSRDPARARELAAKLHHLNEDRRATEAAALRDIEAQIDSLLASPAGLPACLVLDDAPPADPASDSSPSLSSPLLPPARHPEQTLSAANGDAKDLGIHAAATSDPAPDRSPSLSSPPLPPSRHPEQTLSAANGNAKDLCIPLGPPPSLSSQAHASSLRSLSASRHPEPSGSGLLAPERTGALAPGASSPPTTRWHRGVVGILASRVVDRTGRPALVIAHEDGVAHGSGRSVPGFHLLGAITAAHQHHESALFSRFGGHAHAVGFALPSTRVPDLRVSLAAIAFDRIGPAPAAQALRHDLEIRLSEITPDFLAAFERLGPFGIGNPDPLLLTRAARLLAPPRPLKERHLRLTFQDQNSPARFSGVAWARRASWAERAAAERWSPGDAFDIAFHLRRNWHPDFGGWELEIISLDRSPIPSPPAP